MCETIKACPDKVKTSLAKCFELWTDLIVRCSAFIFIVAVTICLLLSTGSRYEDLVSNKDKPFAPEVSTIQIWFNSYVVSLGQRNVWEPTEISACSA